MNQRLTTVTFLQLEAVAGPHLLGLPVTSRKEVGKRQCPGMAATIRTLSVSGGRQLSLAQPLQQTKSHFWWADFKDFLWKLSTL